MLVVDDNREVAAPLIMLLEYEGHVVRYADDGDSGLLAVSDHFPDVIFLDIEMPKLNGPEMAYRLLIQDAGRENIPIIVLSGVANLEEVAEKIGTPYFLPKPFPLDKLELLFERALKERRPPRTMQRTRGAA